MLDALKLSPEVTIEEDKDVLGGGGPLSTDIYDMVCEYMYLDQTKSGAVMAYGNFKEVNTGRNVRFSECVMSKKSGTLKATYTDKKSGKEKPLPGYSKVFHLAQIVGLDIQDLSGLACEKRALKLWDKELRKETDQEKNVLVDLLGKPLKVAVYKVLETKMEDDGTGSWDIPTSEEFAKNDLVKWFNTDGLTLEEVANGTGDELFADQWLKAHKGKERDNRVKGAPTAGAPKLGGNVPAAGGLSFD
jgi:hypothetical protein